MIRFHSINPLPSPLSRPVSSVSLRCKYVSEVVRLFYYDVSVLRFIAKSSPRFRNACKNCASGVVVTSRLRAQRNNVELGSTVRTIRRCSVINRVNCEASPVSQRTWPNGKLVRFWSCGICFDSESGQISDFTIAVLSFPP